MFRTFKRKSLLVILRFIVDDQVEQLTSLLFSTVDEPGVEVIKLCKKIICISDLQQ